MTNVLAFRAKRNIDNDPTEQSLGPVSQDYRDVTIALNKVRDSLSELNKALEDDLELIAEQFAKTDLLGGAGKHDDAFATLIPMTLEKAQGTGSLG